MESKISCWGNLRGPKNLSGLPSLPRAICEHTVGTSLLQTRDNIANIYRLAANVGSFILFICKNFQRIFQEYYNELLNKYLDKSDLREGSYINDMTWKSVSNQS